MPHISSLARDALLTLLLILVLSGCGLQLNSGQSNTTFRIWYGTDDPVERVWSQELAHRYQRLHPNVSVSLQDLSFADMNTKLQLALSGGNPPDIAYVTPRGPGIPSYVAAGQLRDLTQVARNHGWGRLLRPGLLAQYNQPFRFYGTRPHSIVAVPTSMAAVGILYNQRLLSRLRLPIPTTLATFEHALSVAKHSRFVPIGIGNADGWLGDDWYLTLANALAPVPLLNAEQRLSPRFSFQHPALRRSATILQRWSNAGYFTPDFGGLDAQESVDQFFRGQTLFQLVSSSQNSQIRQAQQQTHLPIGLFAFPSPLGKVMPQSGYEGWVIPKQARHPVNALSFIDMLLSRTSARFLTLQGLLPAHRVQGPGVVSRQWQRDEIRALSTSRPGIYLDAAPIASLNATMEANVQLLLQGYESPTFLIRSLQDVYASRGRHGSTARIDGEF